MNELNCLKYIKIIKMLVFIWRKMCHFVIMWGKRCSWIEVFHRFAFKEFKITVMQMYYVIEKTKRSYLFGYNSTKMVVKLFWRNDIQRNLEQNYQTSIRVLVLRKHTKCLHWYHMMLVCLLCLRLTFAWK